MRNFTAKQNTRSINGMLYSFKAKNLQEAIKKAPELLSGEILEVYETNDIGEKLNKTFDIYFHDSENSNNKGFSYTYEEAINYVRQYNGSNESYFADYKGGTVQIVDNETQEVIHEEEIK